MNKRVLKMQFLQLATLLYLSLAAIIPWDASLESAMKHARAENKPVFLLYVFGRLDEPFT